MFKNKVYILIYVSIVLPVLLSAAPLDKYYVPQQSSGYTAPKAAVSESVYDDFRDQIRNYSKAKKEKMKKYYRKKRDEALREKF